MLTKEERDEMKRLNPDCYFVRLIGYGHIWLMAIPKPTAPVKRGGMFDCAELLHGMTIRLAA